MSMTSASPDSAHLYYDALRQASEVFGLAPCGDLAIHAMLAARPDITLSAAWGTVLHGL